MDSCKIENFIELADEQVQNGDLLCAIKYYKKHLEQNPDDAFIYNRIGYLYGKVSQYDYLDEQIKYFYKVLEFDPENTTAIRNLALTYPLMGKTQEAVDCFHKLFKLGSLEDDYFAYACLKIKLGDFEEGWKYYEARFLKKFGATYYPRITKPQWEGEDIKDKTLFVHYEQGLGDSIMFFRYLKQIEPFAGKIIFKVQKELYNLFSYNTGNIEIVKTHSYLVNQNFDYHIPIMSFPRVLKSNIENIPFSEGYLKADERKTQKFKKEFFDNDCLKIGIAWNGMKTGNRKRDIPLEYFYSLCKLKNVQIYSFQKGFGTEQLENLPSDVKIIDFGKEFNDFSDTAAAMENLDLFITSDNGVFNLAGAMGKKTFLLLNKNSEWRWFLDEEKTPWYDSVRIFKKKHENDGWDLLMKKVMEEIKKGADFN